MSVLEPFVDPGRCSMADCEVTLKFDNDDSFLYVCKHALVNLGDYFKTMLCGGFKEKDKNEIEMHEVSRSDMLLFLQFTIPIEKYETKPKPANITQLYTLILLSDRFLYPKLCQDIVAHLPEWAPNWSPSAEELCQLFTLGDRLLCCDLNQAFAKHILYTEKIYEKSNEFKLAIVEAAYKHRESSTVILEACVRLCANLEFDDVAQLQGKEMNGVAFAICATIGKAMPKMSAAPKHFKNQPHAAGAGIGEWNVDHGRRQFDCVRFANGKRSWWWRCSKCNSEWKGTLSLEQIMDIDVENCLLQ